jgi:4-hydroxy-4-methyl-2-oxoglutarate aldolase
LRQNAAALYRFASPKMSTNAIDLQKLTAFDTPTICNAIELFGVIPRNRGYMDSRIKANFPEMPPIVGFAATASFRSDAPPMGGDAYTSIEAQLEQFANLPGPPIVAIQDLDDPAVSAVFGEVMCSTYKAFGGVGLITNGAGRDLEQIRGLKFPVFTSGAICSHGYCHLLHLGLPVRLGGLTVHTGDLLHADANGVARIPLEIADQLAEVAAEFVAAEGPMISYAKSPGEKSIARWSILRGEFQDAISKLTKRVSRMK